MSVQAVSYFGNPYQFTARRFDSKTSLHYFRARYVTSSQGRFLSRDPQGNLSSHNLFEYAVNNPVNFFDPMGTVPVDCSTRTKPRKINISSGDISHAKDPNTIGAAGVSIASVVNKLKSLLGKCECISEIALRAHSNPTSISIRGRKKGEDWKTYPEVTTGEVSKQTEITEANATGFIKLIKAVACFCNPCTIYLLACNVGLGKIPQAIANASGCTVKAPMGYCYANLVNPGVSRIEEKYKGHQYPGAKPEFKDFKPETTSSTGKESSSSKPGKPVPGKPMKKGK